MCAHFSSCKACAHGKGFLLPFRDLLNEIFSSQKGAFTFKSVFLVCVTAVEVYSCCSSGTQRNQIFMANILLQLCICFLCSLFFDEIFHEYIEKKYPESIIFPLSFSVVGLTMIIPNVVLMFVGRF